MNTTWLMDVAVLSQALPGLAALRARRTLTGARIGVVAWSVIMLLGNAVDYWLASHHQNNHIVSYVAQPITCALVLWVLSRWQVTAKARRVILRLIPVYLVAMLALTLTVEITDTFSLVTESVTSLLILALSLYTLLTCSLAERGRLTRFDWFWICVGMALFYGGDAAFEPFSRAMMASHIELVIAAIDLTSAIEVFALLAIARGMLCPIPPLNSGGSSSHQPLPWPFSSPRSGPPS